MEFEPLVAPHTSYNKYGQERRPRSCIETLLLGGFVLFLLLGAGSLVALWYYDNQSQPRLSDAPWATIQPDRLLAQLALLQLAGDAAVGLAFQAMNAGELETARAITLYDTQSSGSVHLSLFLQLARRFREAKATLPAAQSYWLARQVALLEADLSSLARGQALVQATEGLLKSDEAAAALDTAIQARRVTEQAPDLLPVQRGQLFAELRPLVQQLGDQALGQALDELTSNPYIVATGQLLTETLVLRGEAVPLPADLLTAIATRQAAARALAQRIALTTGSDIDPERQALAQALVAEDQARHNFILQQPGANLPLLQQLWLGYEQRRWLISKAQVARKAFGLSIVPEWETNYTFLEQEITTSTNDLLARSEALAQSTPGATGAQMRVVMLRWLALQSELGTFPNPPANLNEKLGAVQTELAQANQPLAFPIAKEIAGDTAGVNLNGSDTIPSGYRIQPSK